MWNDNRLHWIYPLHWPSAVPPNAQKLPHRYSINQHLQTLLPMVRFHSLNTNHPPLKLPMQPNRNIQKVYHGGGTSSGAEWISRDRTERGEGEQLRGAAAVFCLLLATLGDEVL